MFELPVVKSKLVKFLYASVCVLLTSQSLLSFAQQQPQRRRRATPPVQQNVGPSANYGATQTTPNYSANVPTKQWELSGGSSAAFALTHVTAGTSFNFSVLGEADYALTPMIEIGLMPSLSIGQSVGGSMVTTYGLAVGPVFNFAGPDGLANALFVGIWGNYKHSAVANNFGALGTFGKRIQLFDSLVWKPMLLAGYDFSSSTLSVTIYAINFSFFY